MSRCSECAEAFNRTEVQTDDDAFCSWACEESYWRQVDLDDAYDEGRYGGASVY